MGGTKSRASVRVVEDPSSGSSIVAGALTTLFGKLRSWSMDRVRQVNEMTSSEVLAAGDALSAIVSESRNYVEHMRRTMGSFQSGESSDDGISSIQHQGRMLTEFIGGLEKGLSKQDGVAREALEQLGSVRRAGAHMLTVSNQARMLAVNASIEAARLSNESGGAFGVIASEMSAFAKNMQIQSDEILNIVDGLTRSLPKIAEQAAHLKSDTERFSREFEDQNAKVSDVVARLSATIGEGLREGDNRVAKILSLSQDALSHLQFQDPCAQRLLQIEADILRAEQCAAEVVLTESADPVESFGTARSHRDVSAGHVMIFDDGAADSVGGDAALAAGEVLLF